MRLLGCQRKLLIQRKGGCSAFNKGNSKRVARVWSFFKLSNKLGQPEREDPATLEGRSAHDKSAFAATGRLTRIAEVEDAAVLEFLVDEKSDYIGQVIRVDGGKFPNRFRGKIEIF